MYHRDFVLKDIPRPKKERKLPVTLSHGEVLRIAQTIQNPKHRLMIELMYAAGRRVSEVVELRVQDVNTEELTLFVRGGKGEKVDCTGLHPYGWTERVRRVWRESSFSCFITNNSSNSSGG